MGKEMKDLIKASLSISKAITWNTDIWLTVGNELDFSKLEKNVSVAVIYNETSDTIKEGRNVVICRVETLKKWIKDNRSRVNVKGSVVSIKMEDIYSLGFAKYRGFVIRESRSEEPVGLPPIETNGMKVRSVECKDGKFRDRFFDEEGNAYKIAVGRGWTAPDGIAYYKAKEPTEFIEVDDVK